MLLHSAFNNSEVVVKIGYTGQVVKNVKREAEVPKTALHGPLATQLALLTTHSKQITVCR